MMKSNIFVATILLVISSILSPVLQTRVNARNASIIVLQDYLVYLPVIQSNIHHASVPLDDIAISITSPIMPGNLEASDPGDVTQLATAIALNPYIEFSIISIAYGTAPSTEALPSAEVGGAYIYRTALIDLRKQQGGTPIPGPDATLFEQKVTGNYTILNLKVSSEVDQPVLIVEWVVEAMSRLWIVRVSRDLK